MASRKVENNMIYFYNGKYYIRAFENRITEVNITKIGNEYNVTSTGNRLEINPRDISKMIQMTVAEAYERKNKSIVGGK